MHWLSREPWYIPCHFHRQYYTHMSISNIFLLSKFSLTFSNHARTSSLLTNALVQVRFWAVRKLKSGWLLMKAEYQCSPGLLFLKGDCLFSAVINFWMESSNIFFVIGNPLIARNFSHFTISFSSWLDKIVGGPFLQPIIDKFLTCCIKYFLGFEIVLKALW